MAIEFTVEHDHTAITDVGEEQLIGNIYFTVQTRPGDFRVRNSGAPTPRTINLERRKAYLAIDGHLYKDQAANQPFRLVANDPAFSLEHITYRADFELTNAVGVPFPVPSTYFPAPSTDTTLYLTRVMNDVEQTVMEVRTKGYAEDILDISASGLVVVTGTAADARSALGVNLIDLNEVSWFANLAAFPGTGVADVVYGARDTGKLYLWTGSSYVAARAAVTSTDITDASASGRTVVTGTPTAARAAIGAPASQVATTHAPAFGLYFPEAEGAVGDASHDDTAALNATIAAAPAGSRIQLAAGKTYKISAPITFAGKSHITFDGNQSTIHMVGTGAGYGAFEMSGACTGIHIQNVRVAGSALTADQHVGVWIHDSASNIITDCSVTKSRFTNLCDGISVNLTTAGGTLNGWLVEGCHVENMVGTSSGFGYGIHVSAGTQMFSTGVRIVNNNIKGAQRHSIYHANGEGSVIAGNTIRDHRATVADGSILPAINVTRSRDVTVVGNNVDGFSDGAIVVACESGALDGCTVVGNTLSDPQNTAPVVTIGDPATPNAQTRNVTVVGNTIKSTSTGRLLLIRSGTNVLVANNTLSLNNAGGGSVFELAGSSDTGGTANYNDCIVLRGNEIFIEGGGTAYAFRLTGIETSTARLEFDQNAVYGATATFITSANATNPNIIIKGAADGLNFNTGVGVDWARMSGSMFLPNRTATPSFAISGGAYLWAQSGAIRAHSTNASPTLVGNITPISANYTVLNTDAVILGTAGASGITATLPSAGTKGLRFVLKKVDSAAGVMTVNSTSGTIDGATARVLSKQNDSMEVVADGTNWLEVKPVLRGAQLGRTYYAPAGRTTYTTTSLTLVAIDTTNLTVSFVAPPSGAVTVRLQGQPFVSATGFESWALLDHTTAAQVGVAGSVTGLTQLTRQTLDIDVTGLTPGTVYQYDWAWAVSGAITGSMYAGTQSSPAQGNGPVMMTVLAA